MNLNDYGWLEYIKHFPQFNSLDFDVGRIAVENKVGFDVVTKYGLCQGALRGRVLSGVSEMGFPKVGDWVRITKLPNENKVMIEEILPRFGQIARKDGHDEKQQILVTNVDAVFIVQSVPEDFSLRRLERYLVVARQSGAQPVVVINKVDLLPEYYEIVAEAKAVAMDAPVLAVSATTKHGMDALEPYLRPGFTVVFIGSSGVGKSSLVNQLLGQETQSTHAIREDDGRGRHTTTRREMLLLPTGAIVIDTPGMRELALWADDSELRQSFEDVDDLALQCRFSNCDHDKSQGCAVKAALDDGILAQERYLSYLKLKKETDYLASKDDNKKKRALKAQAKQLSKKVKNLVQHKDKYRK